MVLKYRFYQAVAKTKTILLVYSRATCISSEVKLDNLANNPPFKVRRVNEKSKFNSSPSPNPNPKPN